MLSSPFFSQEDNFDMKSGGGRTFSGNNAHSDSNSSVMLRTAAKPEATEVEIPDWTDGKVREMMDDYERECAAGMTPTEASRRKREMLAEIEIHQGALIKELEKIHQEQGKAEDTGVLLSIWRKKMDTWQNEVNSLGEDCRKSIKKPEKCEKFDPTLETYQTKCAAKKLTPDMAQDLRDKMQNCIDNSRQELDDFNKEIQKLIDIRKREQKNAEKGYIPDPDLDKEIKQLELEYEAMKNHIEEDENELGSLEPYKEDNCISFKESTKSYDIPFIKGDFDFDGDPDKIKDLQEIVTILQKNPKNHAILQPRTKNPKSALFGLINGVALIKGRKKTLEDYFKGLNLFNQITIIVNDNSYNQDWDVQGTIQEYEYDLD